MGNVEMVMPQMGESITEATISKWLKKVGEYVQRGETILEISTDKVDSEVPSPTGGTVRELKFSEGDVVPVKSVIALIEEGAAATESTSAQLSTSKPENANQHSAERAPAPRQNGDSTNPEQGETQEEEDSEGTNPAGGRFYSPLVKSLAQKHEVSLGQLDPLPGSGQGGRFTKNDFMEYLGKLAEHKKQSQPGGGRRDEAQATTKSVEKRGSSDGAARPQASTPSSVTSVTPTTSKSATPSQPTQSAFSGGDESQVIPMDAMRRAIAEHMVRSKATSPHVYSVQEVDVTPISRFRSKWKEEFQKREGFGLSFTPFFLYAAVKALLKFPHVNASIEGQKILLHRSVHLGCAVALPNQGLVVPVIRSAEEKNLVGLARSLNDLAARARSKRLSPEEVRGGTFSVTNPGVFGTVIGTPIINQPQSGILCLGAIKKRPVVIDDMIAIREMCYLTLSYDHRIIDGSLSGQFLANIREQLEGWDLDQSLF